MLVFMYFLLNFCIRKHYLNICVIIAVKVDEKNRNLICSGNKKKDYYIATDEGVIMVPRRTWPTD